MDAGKGGSEGSKLELDVSLTTSARAPPVKEEEEEEKLLADMIDFLRVEEQVQVGDGRSAERRDKLEAFLRESEQQCREASSSSSSSSSSSCLGSFRKTEVVLASAWRSGSTVASEALASHPGAFLHYEPFLRSGNRLVRGYREEAAAREDMGRLLDCEYHNLSTYA